MAEYIIQQNGCVHTCMSASTCLHTQMHVHTFPNPIYLTTQITEFFSHAFNSIHYWILLYYKKYYPPKKHKRNKNKNPPITNCLIAHLQRKLSKKKTVTVCVSDFLAGLCNDRQMFLNKCPTLICLVTLKERKKKRGGWVRWTASSVITGRLKCLFAYQASHNAPPKHACTHNSLNNPEDWNVPEHQARHPCWRGAAPPGCTLHWKLAGLL